MTDGPGQIAAFDIHETHYPYINIKNNLFNPLITSIRRASSDFNPFALRQVPSQDRMALGFRWGNQFYSPNVYPNGIFWYRMFPGHYDPLKGHQRSDGTYQDKKFAPGEHGILVLTADKLPRPCIRSVQAFKRCEMVNGQDKCTAEKNDIIDICPNWALDEMKEKTRLIAKVQALQNNQYRRVMEVSDYNKGRSLGQVSDKIWVHGTREYLRPDTMWPDERYSKISQAEINEAKKRFEAREAARKHHEAKHAEHGGHGEHKHHDGHHYDFLHVPYKEEKPLYP